MNWIGKTDTEKLRLAIDALRVIKAGYPDSSQRVAKEALEKIMVEKDYVGDFLSRGGLRKPDGINEEFSLKEFADFCRESNPLITDVEAREMLRPYERHGRIRYVEMMFWRKTDEMDW